MTGKLLELDKLRADRQQARDMADDMERAGDRATAEQLRRRAAELSIRESLFGRIHHAPIHRETREAPAVVSQTEPQEIDSERFPHLAHYRELQQNNPVAASLYRSMQAYNIHREELAHDAEGGSDLPPAA